MMNQCITVIIKYNPLYNDFWLAGGYAVNHSDATLENLCQSTRISTLALLANQGPEFNAIIGLRYSYCIIVFLRFYCDNTN